jgi:cell fate regulator YaaT (PSP1 superfamily)
MVKIIGVRFRNASKVYYFDPKDMDLKRGDRVIVETSRGVECGKVVLSPREVEEEKVVLPLREVKRIATESDLKIEKENMEKEKEAYRICRQKIRQHELEMKLVLAEYTFDRKKVMFYFTADGRVDFRELVKDLASVFKTRIELRQIGVRDETKLLGGIGICGRPFCCATYLSEFAPVSIKMAKEQNLSLNPTKISGVCGRLMCCLKNEEETYEYLNKRLPGLGDIVETPDGQSGEVQAVNVLRQKVRVLIESGDDKEIADYPADEIVVIAKKKKGGKQQVKEAKEAGQPGESREGKEIKEMRESGEPKECREQKENRETKEKKNSRDRKENRENKEAQENREEGQKRPEGEGRRRRNRGRKSQERAEGQNRENRGGEKNESSAKEGRNGSRRREGRAQNEEARGAAEGAKASDNRNADSPEKNAEKTGRRRSRRNRRRSHSGAEQKGKTDQAGQNGPV